MKKSEVYAIIKKAVKVYNLEGDKLFTECEKEIKKIDTKINNMLDKMNLVELTLYTIAKQDLDNGSLNTEDSKIHRVIFERNAETIESELLNQGIILD